MENKQQEKHWTEELADLAEKHCKHDNSKLNNCLFHIFKPFIEKHFISKKELEEHIDGCRETTIDGMWWVNRNDLLKAIKEKYK